MTDFFFAWLCPTVEMSKEAQSLLDNLWIFKFGFIPYLKIIHIFLTKLIRVTLAKFLLKVLSYGRCLLLLPEFLGLFLPRCPFGWKRRPVLFHNKLVCSGGGEEFWVTIVSSECGWGNFDDYLGEEGEEVSFKESI